jgi:serine/threonine protein kinase/formylglycine-generating enzyme required for sulfatase activity
MSASVDDDGQQNELDRVAERLPGELERGDHPHVDENLPHDRDVPIEQPPTLSLDLDFEIDGERQQFQNFDALTRSIPPARCISPPTTPPAGGEDELQSGRLGRYEIQRVLGRGGFGIVYLAFDPQLGRQVALKVPRADRFANQSDLEKFLVEARTAARLKHPRLVAIYDVQQLGNLPFIVQEYIESRNLAEWRTEVRPSFEQIAQIMVGVAEAVSYIHQEGLIHCDLKSANILIDPMGQPYVTDFGLATHESGQHLLKGQRFGTPYAMAPEQVRGESHLMDGRTDIWALGVMLYQMLTGRQPFVASTREELFEIIRTHDPKPPRQCERSVPKELERICLKCMAQRRADRYNTVEDLRDDILTWLNQHPTGDQAPPTAWAASKPPFSSKSELLPSIVPKGLRAYDAEDADFFLALLPGPRDREGLPESVRFWRNRIEQRDPDQTFRVGLLYGPSGCGKSSLVKAGLLPRLTKDVLPIYVEATPDDTEARLRLKLRNQVPSLSATASLPEICAELRKGKAPYQVKVLLVVDQFEQWLHAHALLNNCEFVDALRQCDGGKLQALLMVRDDFFLSVNRVFQELEIRLVEGSNCGMVDNFDLNHARKVLALLGRAYGRLGDSLTALEEKFLAQAIDDLAENSKVICVHLALFADMMKSRPWIPASLQDVGGVRGVGVAMLEETFNRQTAPLSYRIHEDAIRRVLKAMLPSAGTGIKGAMQPVERLRDVAGYVEKPREFNEVLEILDSERRLITPTDSAGLDPDDDKNAASRYYQLTHDYLVPSLRTWLTRKQTERLRGRAELRLADIAADWALKPNHTRLPAMWEYVGIRFLTNASSWSPNEWKVMRAAGRFHGKRWAITLAVLILLGAVIRNVLVQERNKNYRRQAELLVNNALNAPAAAVPYAAQNVEPVREYALPVLRQRFEDLSTDPPQRLRAAVLLTQFGEPRVEYLTNGIESADRHECPNVVAALRSCGDSALGPLHEMVARAESQHNWRLKAKLAMTLLQLGEVPTALQMLRLERDPIERVTFIDTIPQWCGSLQRILERVDQSDSGSFRSGLILGIGSIPLDQLLPSEVDAASRKFTQWYRDMPDSGTHSAAGWALRHWRRSLPEEISSHDADWQVNSVGMTMLKIPPAESAAAGRQPLPAKSAAASVSSFWLSDCEISRRTYQKFIDDRTCPESAKPVNREAAAPERSPTPEHPVQSVNWIDAVLFCNWLSRREHRDESYVWDGKAWQLVAGSSGYRLPTDVEWEYACRAGTTTEFFSGNDERFLESYAVYRSNQTASCGSKMPNPWGLFDVHGNVFEWCQDRFVQEDPAGRVIRSGAFDYSSLNARSSNRQSNSILRRSYTIGIRVARSGT